MLFDIDYEEFAIMLIDKVFYFIVDTITIRYIWGVHHINLLQVYSNLTITTMIHIIDSPSII